MRNRLFLAIVLMLALVLTACGKKKTETYNMEQIQREQGVPVTVQTMQPDVFSKELTYTCRLEGIRRTTQGAMVGGKVVNVLARVGQAVKQDQVLVEFADDNPSAQYLQAKAAYENARSTRDRMKALYEAGGISQLDMDNAQTAFEVNEANYNAVSKMIRPQAPISGIVTAMNVRVSDNVEPGDQLFTVSQVDRMKTEAWVPETEIGLVKAGQAVHAAWQGRTFSGHVTQVAYDLNRDMQGFGVQMELNNPDKVFQGGMTADVSIEVYRNDKAFVIPRKVLQSDSDGSYVFVEADGVAAKRYVQIGRQNGLSYEVTGGLQAGDRVILTGLNLIKDGSKLAVQE